MPLGVIGMLGITLRLLRRHHSGQSDKVSVCGLAGATNGRAGCARAGNTRSEDSVAETALSKKNSDGKEAAGLPRKLYK